MTVFKKILVAFIALVVVGNLSLHAQMVNAASWEYKVKQTSPKEAELLFTVKLDAGWHIYPTVVNDGPLPTVFNFPKINGYSLVGAVKDPANGHPDKAWQDEGVTVNSWEGTVTFKQKIKILTDKKLELTVPVEYMVCNAGQCVPGDYTGKFVLNANASETASVETDTPPVDTTTKIQLVTDGVKPVAFRFVSKKFNANEYELVIRSQVDTGWFISSKNDAKYPLKFKFNLPKGVELKGESEYSTSTVKNPIWSTSYKLVNDFSQRFYVESGDSTLMKEISVEISYASTDGKSIYIPAEKVRANVDMSAATLQIDPKITSSYIWIFIGAFLSGFVALVMPCIFPMIPMTVSFFLKRSKNRKQGIANAITYGLSIIVIYVTLGLIITAIFGSDSLNALATNVWFNLFFFAMLVVFAFSFLGAFEITLPSSWVSAADKRADKGGLAGIFFMAFTLALVSFSCTGPIVGDLLVIASKQGGWGPFWGMLGFSLAIALPFALFAIFPSWLNSMPQSGGWLNTVKVSLGFLELAFSFKFLSNADLVVQAHLLERETFIAIWIAIFGIWGLYLLGKFKLSHDSDVQYISTGRLTTAVLVFSFVIYLIPGMWGAPVKWIAGFPPGQHYSESPYGILGKAPAQKKNKKVLPADAKPVGTCHIMACHTYETALEYARAINKPLLIDFTGYACVNCRKMEETVWCEPTVEPILKDSVVLVSLYVDDKHVMPDSMHYVSKFDGKNIITYGQKWSDMQKSRYGSNAQPQYFLLDHYETILNGSANYQDHGSEKKFNEWLVKGLKQFELFNGSIAIEPVMVIAINK